MIAWESPLTRKLSVFVDLQETERAFLADLEADTTHLPSHAELVRRGQQQEKGYIVRDGWAVRSKTLSDGRRQVIDVVLPGNIVGLYHHVSPVAEETITAIKPMIVSAFQPGRMIEMFTGHPRLASAIAWLAAREDQILAERLVSMGRRSAFERLAHLFLELWERLRIRGLAGNGRLPIPLTQQIIADALGLSVVHVNRTLSQLARAGLVQVNKRDKMLVILDHDGLRAAAGFEPDYLLHRQMPQRLSRELEAWTSARPGAAAASASTPAASQGPIGEPAAQSSSK